VTRDTNGHVTKVNTKTVTLPAQYSHPTYTRSNTTSSASPAHGGTFTAIDSITTNSLGHVTAVNTKTVTLPTDQNTDTKVTQTNTTTDASYRLLFSENANDTTETTTARKSTTLQFNPTSGLLTTKDITMYNSSNGETPGIIFRRGTFTDTYNDWKIWDNGGLLYFGQRGSNSTAFDKRIYFGNDGDINAVSFIGEFIGKLSRSTGGSWIDARDNTAVLNGGTNGGGSFFPIGFAKTNDGGWGIGAIPNTNVFYLSYTTDANYASNTNTSTYTIEFPKASGTVALTNHTHDSLYIPLTGSNAISGSLETNSQNAGFVSLGPGNRKMSLINGGISYYIGTTNWAEGVSYRNGAGDTSLGSIGAYGTPSTCDYFYMGKEYNNVAMRVENDNTGKMTLRGTLPQLRFQQTTSNSEYAGTCGIIAYPVDTSGTNTVIQSGGNTIIGSGEIANIFMTTFNNGDRSDINKYPYRWRENGEQAYLAADEAAYIWTNGGSWDSTKKYFSNLHCFVFNAVGNFLLPVGGGIYYQYGTRDENGMVNTVVQSGLVSAATTTARTWTLPDASGTICLTSHTHAAGDITSGALPIAHGGTGATTRLDALKALTNEDIGTSAQFFLTITSYWGKGGYTSVANAKTVLGLGSAAYTASTDYATAGHTHSNYLGAVNANGYVGMAKPDGTATDWIRTTNKGLIPYESGSAGSGHQSLGTSTWYFANAYIDNVNCSLLKISGTLPQLRFQQTTSGSEYDSGIIAYPADKNGMNMVIRSGGNMIIGGGEYPATFYNATKTTDDHWSNGGENIYVGADSYVVIQPLGDTIANRKSFYFGNDLNLALNSNICFNVGNSSTRYGGTLSARTITAGRTWTLPNASGGIGVYNDLYTSTAAPTATSQTINLNGNKTIIGVYDILKVWIYVNSTGNIRQIDMCVMTAAMAQAAHYFTGVGTSNQKMLYLNSNGYSLQLGTSGTQDSSKISIAKVIGIKF
jgi:hypothetical protein